MSFRNSINDFFNAQANYGESFGEQGAKFRKTVVEEAGKLVCRTWKAYPDWITGNRNIITSMTRGYMTTMCAPENPPFPTIPDECTPLLHVYGIAIGKNSFGGNCDKQIFWRTNNPVPADEIEGLNEVTLVDETGWFIEALGQQYYKIQQITESRYDNLYTLNLPGAGSRLPRSSGCENELSAITYMDLPEITFTQIANEIPSTCDDDIKYPETSPPDVIEYNTYINNEGDPFYLNLKIENIFDGGLQYPITVNVNNVLNLTLDFGGWEFDTIPNPAPNQLPVITPTSKEDDGDCITPVPRPADEELEEESPTGQEEGEEVEEIEEIKDGIKWVLIDVTTFPYSGKTIVQSNSEDNTFFAGYFSWIVNSGGNYRMAEQPIRKQKNAYRAPDNIEGYRAFTVNGAKISVRQFIQQIEE